MTDPNLTSDQVRELAEIPAVEVITRAAVMLMSAAAEKLAGPQVSEISTAATGASATPCSATELNALTYQPAVTSTSSRAS